MANPPYNEKIKSFAIQLYKINAIKFGEFKLKTGLISPIYCDLRVIVSYPKILSMLSELIVESIGSFNRHKLLCGVPYTALPIATVISISTGVPMVMRRKEAKSYGTKKLIEGEYKEGDNCLIIEDIVTSGSSILETVKDLKDAGLDVTDAVVVLDREQGGMKILKDNGVNIQSLLTISQLLQFLEEEKCIEKELVQKVKNYIQENQVNKPVINKISINRLKLSYENRIQYAQNKTAQQLLKIMSEKQTNLCVAADLTSSTKILHLSELLGPHICILKTHIDIIEDFTAEFTEKLKKIAKSHNFLIMEDRKFADIGKTVQLQFSKGVYHISNWANLITAHSLPGKGLIQALESSDGIERGIFLLSEMSSAGNLITESYTSETIKLAKDFPDSIAGIVGQSPQFLDTPGILQLTPGIQLESPGDNLGQQYNSPEIAVVTKGADIGVVGRGITQSENPEAAAQNYKKLLWDAYIKRISN